METRSFIKIIGYVLAILMILNCEKSIAYEDIPLLEGVIDQPDDESMVHFPDTRMRLKSTENTIVPSLDSMLADAYQEVSPDVWKEFLKDYDYNENTQKIKHLLDSLRESLHENFKQMISSFRKKRVLALDLGPDLNHWVHLFTLSKENGREYALFIHFSSHINELLEIHTIPYCWYQHPHTLWEYYESEEKILLNEPEIKINLKAGPDEIFYDYMYIKNQKYTTGLVRNFISNKMYYSIRYITEHPKKLKKKDIASMKKKLKQIKVKDTAVQVQEADACENPS